MCVSFLKRLMSRYRISSDCFALCYIITKHRSEMKSQVSNTVSANDRLRYISIFSRVDTSTHVLDAKRRIFFSLSGKIDIIAYTVFIKLKFSFYPILLLQFFYLKKLHDFLPMGNLYTHTHLVRYATHFSAKDSRKWIWEKMTRCIIMSISTIYPYLSIKGERERESACMYVPLVIACVGSIAHIRRSTANNRNDVSYIALLNASPSVRFDLRVINTGDDSKTLTLTGLDAARASSSQRAIHPVQMI